MKIQQIKPFLMPPTFPDVNKTRRAAHLFTISYAVILITVAVNISRIAFHFVSDEIITYSGLLVVVMLIFLLIARRGFVTIAAMLLTTLFFFSLMLSTVDSGGIHATGYLGGVVLTLLIAILLLGWRGLWVFATASLLIGIGLVRIEMIGALPTVRSTVTPVSVLLTQVAFVSIMITLLYMTVNELRQSEQHLRDELRARQIAETALRQSEARYRALAANLPDSAVILFDQDLRFALVDGPEVEKAGFSKTALSGKTLQESLPPEFVQMAEPRMRAVLRGEQLSAELPFGGQIHAYHYVPLKDDQGGVLYGLILARNITAQKMAEHALRQSELKFRTLFEITPYTMVLQRADDGLYLDINRVTYESAGLTREHFVGRTPEEVGAIPWDSDYAKAIRAKLLAQDGIVVREEVTMRIGGTTPLTLLYSSKMFDLDGQKVVLTATVDITELKRVEAEFRALNLELEQRVEQRTIQLVAANKELEAFTYSVSHDLRGPLRAINGFSSTLVRQYASDIPEKARYYLDRVQVNAQRMSTLIDDLLALSQLGRKDLHLENVNMGELAEQVVHEVGSETELARAEVIIGTLPPCYADKGLLTQVFVNLVSNALKYSSKVEKPRIEIGATAGQSECIYFVKDNGVGFDMQFSNKLFGIFQRLHNDNEFEGTGIGLAIVKRIVLRHGGRVWADGLPDQGATFYFTIGDKANLKILDSPGTPEKEV